MPNAFRFIVINKRPRFLNFGYWVGVHGNWSTIKCGTTSGGSDVFTLNPSVNSTLKFPGTMQIPASTADTYYVTVVSTNNYGVKHLYYYDGLISEAMAKTSTSDTGVTEIDSPTSPQYGFNESGTYRFTVTVDGSGNFTISDAAKD